MTYSGAFRRLLAFFIDCLALIAIFALFGIFFFCIPPLQELVKALPMIGFWFYGSLFALTWLYFAFLESSVWQATVGKKLLRLKVVGSGGQRISFLRASARYFSKFLSRALLMIGFLMVFFTKKKQGLHDKIASTFVIR
jgi:uncharacterized RDD family membrane protein YckC